MQVRVSADQYSHIVSVVVSTKADDTTTVQLPQHTF